jgi:hypothetical protein
MTYKQKVLSVYPDAQLDDILPNSNSPYHYGYSIYIFIVPKLRIRRLSMLCVSPNTAWKKAWEVISQCMMQKLES